MHAQTSLPTDFPSPVFTVEAKNAAGEWEIVCTDAVKSAAVATASYLTRRYDVETRVVAPFAHPGTAGFNANTCPACAERCGTLVNGVCLTCALDWDEAIQAAERRYDEEQGAESCCCCGID